MDSKKIVTKTISNLVLLTFLSWQVSPYVYADNELTIPDNNLQRPAVPTGYSTNPDAGAWITGQGPAVVLPDNQTLGPSPGPLSPAVIANTPLSAYANDVTSYFKFNETAGSFNFTDGVLTNSWATCSSTSLCPQSGGDGRVGQSIHFDGTQY